jgi:hypothetical protein
MKVYFEKREEQDWVSIHTERDGKDVVSRPATEEDKARFPVEYAEYVATSAPVPEPEAAAPVPVKAPATAKSKGKG